MNSFYPGVPEMSYDICPKCAKPTFRCECPAADDPLRAEAERLRAGLEMIAQVRHVSGSAQGAFRHNLALADAVLAGADVRDLETVVAIAGGRWKP